MPDRLMSAPLILSLIHICQIAVQFALNGLGSVYVAAFTASQKIDNMAIQPALSLDVYKRQRLGRMGC